MGLGFARHKVGQRSQTLRLQVLRRSSKKRKMLAMQRFGLELTALRMTQKHKPNSMLSLSLSVPPPDRSVAESPNESRRICDLAYCA
eukprot:1365337-Amphidinium_carterae.1